MEPLNLQPSKINANKQNLKLSLFNQHASKPFQGISAEKTLSFMANSPSALSGMALAFKGNITEANLASSKYSQTHIMMPNEHIPDGFKVVSDTHLSVDTPIDKNGKILLPNCQDITVVDRKKDKDLQQIFSEYSSKLPKWKKKYEESLEVFPDLSESDFLIISSKYFVKDYSKNPFQEREASFSQLNKEELMLGKIMKDGNGVFRHNSILLKLLLETQNIDIGMRAGNSRNISNPSHRLGGHAWNFVTDKQGKEKVVDASTTLCGDSENYLDDDFNEIYTDKKPLTGKVKHEINHIQPGDTFSVCEDEAKNLFLIKNALNHKSLFTLEWTKDDKFILAKKDDDKKITLDGSLYAGTNPITIKGEKLLNVEGKYLSINTDQIKANFETSIRKTIQEVIKKTIKEGNFSEEMTFDQIAEQNPDLNIDTVKLFYQDDFRKSFYSK